MCVPQRTHGKESLWQHGNIKQATQNLGGYLVRSYNG